jgi:hypothetical protein
MTWNHRVCGDCWIEPHPLLLGVVTTREEVGYEKEGGGYGSVELIREPARVRDAKPSVCCFCGQQTRLGIFVRKDPRALNCKHPEDE